MASAQDVLNVARGEIGQTGSKYNTAYYGHNSNAPWCCTFLWWCFQQAGMGDMFPKTASVFYAYSELKAKGYQEIKDWGSAQPGDIAFFKNFGHIAIISANNNGTVSRISGNDWDSNPIHRVLEKSSKRTDLQFYLRPNYSNSSSFIGPIYQPNNGSSDNTANTPTAIGTVNSSSGSGDVYVESGDLIISTDDTNTYNAYDKDDGSILPEMKNARTNHVEDRIKKLTEKIENVNKHVQKHDITPFVIFKVNEFELNTRDPDSFNHYAISMENVKTGIGQGNQFKIKIAYHKHFSNYESINQLEQALGPLRAGSLIAYDENNIEETRKSLGKNECSLQYGYITGGQDLITPLYTGLLLKYTVTANKQIVEYTLEGFTGEQIKVDTVNWYPNIRGMEFRKNKVNERVGMGILKWKANEETLTEEKIQKIAKKLNTEYTDGIVFQPYLALDCFFQDYNNSVSEDSTKYYLVDCTGKKLHDYTTLEIVRLALCRGQTPLQYIEYVVGQFKLTETNDYAYKYLQQEKKTSTRFMYELIKDKKDPTKMYVCIDYIDELDEDNLDSKVAYDFKGYSTENNLLVDYNLNYDGTVALSIANNYSDDEEKDENNAIYIDRTGMIKKRVSLSKDMFVAGEIDEVLISKQNSWLDKVSTVNDVKMTTLGLPFEITIGTIFRCGVYITDTLHHTSGNCFVTGVTDRIENNQYLTDFTMIRMPGYNKEILKTSITETESESTDTDKENDEAMVENTKTTVTNNGE